MAGRACARLRLPPALAKAIDQGQSNLSVTFDNEGMTITLGDAAYAFRAAPDNAAISELYEYTEETDGDGFTEDRELAATGFMSNRGRQNVASYLALDLRLDWRMGAEWFESVLIDFEPSANWFNWV